MSSIVNAMYRFDSMFKSAEYDKEIISITSELDDVEAQMEKYSTKKADIEEAKNNKEFYSIFDLKRCEKQIRILENREKALEAKKLRIENRNQMEAAKYKGFKSGQEQDISFEFGFSFK